MSIISDENTFIKKVNIDPPMKKCPENVMSLVHR